MNWFELSVKVDADESVPVSLPTIYSYYITFILLLLIFYIQNFSFYFYFLRLFYCCCCFFYFFIFFSFLLFLLTVPSEAPEILEATSPTSTTIDIKWTEVTQLNSANLKGYGIVYKKIGDKFQVGFLKSVLPTPQEATLDDLEKFTNYTIRVFAFTSLGNGVSSQPFSLPTQEDGKLTMFLFGRVFI